MADRQGIEIDYCPKCRGVWLDRGELDKIIERSTAYGLGPQTDRQEEEQKQFPKQEGYYKDQRYNDPHYKQKKKKGFLGDFFDFD
jgi:Zn-finger nucleic acid-binding protein